MSFPPTRSNRTAWAIEEIGVNAKRIKVDLTKGEQKKPEYLKIHPQGVVPAITIGKDSLFESAAIVLHLAEKYPEARLLPKEGSFARAKCLQWAIYGPAELDPILT